MDECMKCGKKGHFAAECVYYKQNKNSRVVPADDDTDDDDDSDDDDDVGYVCDKCGKTIKDECNYYEHISVCKVGKVGKGNTCFRCGRAGHYSSTCYAKSHVKGYYLHSN
jgi:hypothetical protein